jgi:hypothetical protein
MSLPYPAPDPTVPFQPAIRRPRGEASARGGHAGSGNGVPEVRIAGLAAGRRHRGGDDRGHLGPAGAAELAQYPADVRVDGSLGDGEPGGDLPVGQAVGDQLRNLVLPCGQRQPAGGGWFPLAVGGGPERGADLVAAAEQPARLPDRYGVGCQIQDVSAEALCAKFHKPFPRKHAMPHFIHSATVRAWYRTPHRTVSLPTL